VVPGEEELLSAEGWGLLQEARAQAVESLHGWSYRWCLTSFIGWQLPDRRDWGWFCADDLTEEEKVAGALDPLWAPPVARAYVLVADAALRATLDPAIGERVTPPAVLFEVAERGAPSAVLFAQRLTVDEIPHRRPQATGDLLPVGRWRNGFDPPFRVGQRVRFVGLRLVVTAVDEDRRTITLSPFEAFGRTCTPVLEWWEAVRKVEPDTGPDTAEPGAAPDPAT
jgi:hypothetical protein